MSPLSFVLFLTSLLFLFFAIDAFQRRKMTLLHFILFASGLGLVLAMIFVPWFDRSFSRVFGVAKWSDIIVYGALIGLAYFYFELVHELTKQKAQTTRIVTNDALRSAERSLKMIPETSAEKYGEKIHIAFAIRARNEWDSIGTVIDTIASEWFPAIIITNDGSCDATIETVQAKIAQYPHMKIVLLSHVINRGGGAANKTLFAFFNRYAKELGIEWIVTYDADGQMNINDMKTFRSMHIKEPDVKVFLGSRFVEGGSSSNMPGMRRVILRGSRIVTRIFNRLDVTDPHCGYRMIHRDALAKIQITSDGMMYASEVLDSIRIQRLSYREVPVHISYTDYSLGKAHAQTNRNARRILGEMIYKKIFFR